MKKLETKWIETSFWNTFAQTGDRKAEADDKRREYMTRGAKLAMENVATGLEMTLKEDFDRDEFIKNCTKYMNLS